MRKPTTRHLPFAETLERRTLCDVTTPQVKVNVMIVEVSTNFGKTLGIDSHSFADVTLKNVGAGTGKGPVGISLYLSRNAKLDAKDVLLAHVDRAVKLAKNATSTRRVPFDVPDETKNGKYHVIAKAEPSFAERNAANNLRVTAALLTIATIQAQTLLLTLGTLPGNFPFGVENTVPVTLKNNGNTPTTGKATLKLYSSSDQTLGDGNDRLLKTILVSAVLQAHAARSAGLKFVTPLDFVPGLYFIAVQLIYLNRVTTLFSTKAIGF